jgi:OOP family OmpA-OmpF porin
MTKRSSLFSAFALLAALALPAWTSAEDLKAVVHDARGNPVTDARANCVRTEWETPTDECGAAPAPQAHTRLASVYFEFNKSVLTAQGRATLDELLETLRNKHIEAVTIAGYADVIGSQSYNQRLSEKRARVVQHYLRIHGFQHSNTDVRALGKSHARTAGECQGLKDGKLHACMQEDRRVDIEVGVISR